jgi:uncharacterized protein YjlB
MNKAETYHFVDDGRFPNSVLPLLVYRGVLPPDPVEMECVFAAHDWSNCWRGGIFQYHHFHSNAHEVLGIATGEVRVKFGGPSGKEVAVLAGDVVVISAGVAHCNKGQSADLLVVGAYPGGSSYDIRRGDPAEHAACVGSGVVSGSRMHREASKRYNRLIPGERVQMDICMNWQRPLLIYRRR